jgi:hypothetical protein
VSYGYRVFMVHQANESTLLHLSAERLRDGVVVSVRCSRHTYGPDREPGQSPPDESGKG